MAQPNLMHKSESASNMLNSLTIVRSVNQTPSNNREKETGKMSLKKHQSMKLGTGFNGNSQVCEKQTINRI